jgi:DNA-binding response OmpR family regulator
MAAMLTRLCSPRELIARVRTILRRTFWREPTLESCTMLLSDGGHVYA